MTDSTQQAHAASTPNPAVEAARDYVERYVTALSLEERAAMEKRHAEFFAATCCDEYPCNCEDQQ